MKDKLEKIRVLNKKQRHINDYFMLEYSKIWHNFFLFFVESDPDVFHLPWLRQI